MILTIPIPNQLDYCPGGEVFTYLRRARRFDLFTARFYAAEIFLILEFLHEHEQIAYRDIKPENLLLDAEGHIKLVDFGFAKNVSNGLGRPSLFMNPQISYFLSLCFSSHFPSQQ